LRDFVSIPSNRGVLPETGEDSTPHGRRPTSQSPQIGASFRRTNQCIREAAMARSQSPQIGASFRSARTLGAGSWREFRVSIPSNRGVLPEYNQEQHIWGVTEVVSIPSNRGVLPEQGLSSWSRRMATSQSPQIGASFRSDHRKDDQCRWRQVSIPSNRGVLPEQGGKRKPGVRSTQVSIPSNRGVLPE